jgi:hypothetical protein
MMARFLDDPPVWEKIRQDEQTLEELDDLLTEHECSDDECDFPEAHGSHQIGMMLARKLLWAWEAAEQWAAWRKGRGSKSKGLSVPERCLMMAVGAMEPNPDCEHVKVYSWDYQPGAPPKWKWICSECLAAGEDGLVQDPVTDQDRYWRLAMMRLHQKGRSE